MNFPGILMRSSISPLLLLVLLPTVWVEASLSDCSPSSGVPCPHHQESDASDQRLQQVPVPVSVRDSSLSQWTGSYTQSGCYCSCCLGDYKGAGINVQYYSSSWLSVYAPLTGNNCPASVSFYANVNGNTATTDSSSAFQLTCTIISTSPTVLDCEPGATYTCGGTATCVSGSCLGGSSSSSTSNGGGSTVGGCSTSCSGATNTVQGYGGTTYCCPPNTKDSTVNLINGVPSCTCSGTIGGSSSSSGGGGGGGGGGTSGGGGAGGVGGTGLTMPVIIGLGAGGVVVIAVIVGISIAVYIRIKKSRRGLEEIPLPTRA